MTRLPSNPQSPQSVSSTEPWTGSRTESWSAWLLRRDLRDRARHLAATQRLLYDQTPGNSSTVIFGRDEDGRHGNFHPASYAAICAAPQWARRLAKTHTAHRKLRARADWQWMELDCANSSDALLMNIFCHPQVTTPEAVSAPIASLLGIDTISQPGVPIFPIFGVRPGVPLHTGLLDRTEIDLQLGNLFLEAKLTESNFQTAKPRLIERYRDLEAVFDIGRLPRKHLFPTPIRMKDSDADYNQEEYGSSKRRTLEEQPATERLLYEPQPVSAATELISGYQLIRNVLAAYAADASFCVLCDSRRHDLIETWYTILSAVHRPTFAPRLKLLTWQELAAALPQELQLFLAAKYGIAPT